MPKNNSRNIKIRLMKQSDLGDVANLHQDVFSGFFLSSLGTEFLVAMYYYFLCMDNTLCLIAYWNKTIAGFAVGSINKTYIKKSAKIISNLPALIKIGFKILLSLKLKYYKQIYQKVKNYSKVANEYNTVFLRSIAVQKNSQNKGIGKLLLEKIESEAIKLKANKIKLTTDKIKNINVIKFYKKNSYSISKTVVQRGRRKLLLFEKNI